MELEAGEESFAQLKPRIEALESERLMAVNVDLQRVAIAAAAVGRAMLAPASRARFALLPSSLFDIRYVDDLLPCAQALWYTTVAYAKASVGKTGARLPAELVEEAITTKERLMKLVDYHLSDHPTAGPEIISIRQGTGYIDLATDLSRLAILHAEHNDTLKLDKKHYRAGDARTALSTSQKIIRAMGETSDANQRHWADIRQRTWTLLFEIYDEVSFTGSWLWRHEGGDDRIPSLFADGRGRARRRSSNDKSTSSAEDAGSAEPGKPGAGQGSGL